MIKNLELTLCSAQLYLNERQNLLHVDSIREQVEVCLFKLSLDCYSNRGNPNYEVFRAGVNDLIQKYSSRERMAELLIEDDLIPFEVEK